MRKGACRNRFLFWLGVATLFVAALLIAPEFIPFDTNATNLGLALSAPGENGFLAGSDQLGRSVLARTIAGGRESVILAFGVTLVVAVTGTTVGLVAGYFGGIVDYLLTKVVTAFQAFPSFVLAIAIAGVLGQGTFNMVLAIAAVYWTQYARQVRSMTLSIRKADYLASARICGAKTHSIILKYLLPELIGPLAVLCAISVSDVVLTMAGLSYIGLGPERPTNEWGTMIAEAQPTFQYAIWCMAVPMVALFATVVLFNLLGDSLRDALDSRTNTAAIDVKRATPVVVLMEYFNNLTKRLSKGKRG